MSHSSHGQQANLSHWLLAQISSRAAGPTVTFTYQDDQFLTYKQTLENSGDSKKRNM